MCKLCNTDRPAVKLPSTVSIQLVVYEYLNEYCCTTCYVSLKISVQQNKTDIDKAILTKLYNSYRNYSTTKLYNSKVKTNVVPKRYVKSTFGIVNIDNGFRAFVGKKCLGRYPTLTKALEVKLEYCLENNLTKVIKQIQTKLKELQNANN